ncbi:MAG TPA: ABC transporter permease [Acidimicrobiales bacterium]|jgi:lipooligosaccharide transport system permease protein|nr:ABC transporter permease [Acidimicrobiales bacterium]
MSSTSGTSFRSPAWLRSWQYHATFYAQTWRGSVASTVLFPIFFLASLGVGVGHLVTAHTGLVQGQTYLHFIAPSLLATTTMQLGEGESLWPVLAAVKWVRTYHAAAATPLEPHDILYGKLAWVVTRCFATGIVYVIVIGAFGALQSWWSLTLPFIGALTGLAFSAPLVAFAARSQSDASFTTIYRFAFVPMFLFSATFYPITAYPRSLRPLVQLVPLYHGVALARAAAFGQGSFGSLAGHLAYLIVMAGLGVAWGRRTMRRRLVD